MVSELKLRKECSVLHNSNMPTFLPTQHSKPCGHCTAAFSGKGIGQLYTFI
jgi:hypothetical protein